MPEFLGHRSLGQLLLTGVSGLALLGALAAPAPASAQTWNAGNSNWNNSGNWTPNTVPNSVSSDAVVNNGGTANVDTGITVNNLTIGGTSAVGINDNQSLSVVGTITNSGSVLLNSAGNTTSLFISGGTVPLTGGGQIVLDNRTPNRILGGSGSDVLDNVNNTISGAGQVGANQLTLINEAAGVIDANQPNALTVQLSGGGTNAGTMEATGGGTLVIQGSSIDSSSGGLIQALNGSAVDLNNSTLTGGTLATSGTGVIVNTGGSTLDGTGGKTLTNSGLVQLQDNQRLNIQGVINNTGTVQFNSAGNDVDLQITGGSATLEGGGQVILNDRANNRIYGAAPTNVLDNVDNTISGSGQLGGNGIGLTVINQATIDATGTSNGLVVNTGSGGPVTNTGVMEATGSAGMQIVNTTIDNTTGGNAGRVVANGGNVSLTGGTIRGGTITTPSGVVQTSSGSSNHLDGSFAGAPVNNAGEVSISDNTGLNLEGTINNTGTIAFNSVGDDTDLIINSPTVTLTGNGQVSLNDHANNRIYGTTPSDLLDNVNNTISGSGQFGGNGVGMTLKNEANGIINASGASNPLQLDTGANVVINNGLIEGTGAAGLTILGGTDIDSSGGGTILAASGSGVALSNATLTGGTLQTTGTAAISAVSGVNILDGTGGKTLHNTGLVSVTDNNLLGIQGQIVNTGTIALNSVGDNTNLEITGTSATLTGGGQVILDNRANNRIYGSSASNVLDNVDNTISGAGQIGADGAGLALVNQATINANQTNSLIVETGPGGPVENTGVMESTNSGGLVIANTTIDNTGSSNAGRIVANGGDVYLQGGTLRGGTITTPSGEVQTIGSGNNLDGSTTGAPLNNAGTVGITDNTQLNLEGTINNTGTIAFNSAGNATDLIANGSTVTLTGGGQVAMNNFGSNRIYGAVGADVLDNVNNTIVGSGQLGANQLTFINEASGLVNADQSTPLTEQFSGGGTNKGVMEASAGGTLHILNTTIDNSVGGTIQALAGSSVNLDGATVTGGLLTTSGNGVIQNVSNSTLDGSGGKTLTNTGLVQIDDNTTLNLQGVINNKATLSFASVGNNTNLIINTPTVTLTGGGQVAMNNFGTNRIYGAVGADVLDNVNNTIVGSGQLGANQLTFINEASGVVNADQSTPLTVQVSGGGTNNGLMEATAGATLQILNSAIDSSGGGTIEALNGSSVNLSGATLTGGTLTTVGTGVIQNTSGSTLDGTGGKTLTNNGLVQLDDDQRLNIQGVINNTGTIAFASAGNDTDLQLTSGTVTLQGGGQVVLNNHTSNRIFGAAASDVLNNVDNTISGAGLFGNTEMSFINGAAGTINANLSNTLTVDTGGAQNGVNNGLMEATGAGGMLIQDGTYTNNGTMLAGDGSTLQYQPSATNTNASGGTLTGGTWAAVATGDGATLNITGGPITTDAANIVLSGTGSAVQAYNGSTYDNIQNTLTTIASGGQLHVLNNQNYTANIGTTAIGNAGLIDLGGGTFTSNSLNNSGTLSGFGMQTSSNGSALTNSGTVVATGGNLVLQQGVTGTTGNVTISNGASLDISGAASGNTVGTLQHNGANLNLGSQNVTVSQDYDNANFGVGNSFNKHANVTGSGSILAAGNTGLGVTGADISGGTLSLGNVHVGTTTSSTIDILNTGTAGPVLRGAVQNSGISSSALSLTAQNYGPIALGGTQTVNLGFSPTSAGALSGQSFKVVTNFDNVAPQTVDVTGAAYDLANPLVNPGTISFGNHHVGDVVAQQALTVANNTISDASFQEGLNASFGSTGSGITTNGGTITNLAAGSSNNSSMKLGINTTSAGAISGTATVNLASNGATTSGLGITSLASQSVQVTGGVYNLATSSAIAPVSFGVLHVGDGGGSETKALSVMNTAPTGLFSEGLDSSFGTYTAGGGDTLTPTFAGSITNLAAGSTDSSSMKVTISTATAGMFNGTVTVNQDSNGTIDGLTNTPLSGQNVGVSGNVTASVYNYATAQVNNAPINFGNVRIGSAVASQAISVTNTAPVSAFSENLDASVTPPAPTGFTASGSFTGLAPGATDSSSLVVGLDTSTGGAHSGNVTLGLVSDGSSVAGDGTTTNLPSQTVAVEGNVYRLANPIVNTPSITLAARVGGGLPTASVSVSNSSPDSFTEGLTTSFGAAPSGFTNGGTITNLAAQGTDSSTLSVGLASTATSGVTTGTATLNNVSTGAGTDGATDMSIGSSNVSLTGKVYQTASASVTPSVDFGIVHVGQTVTNQAINVANVASGALVDSITGSIGSVSSAFTNGGGSLGSGVTAGNNSNALTVGLNTTAAGVFSGAADLTLMSHDTDLSDVSLTTSPVTLTAQVNNYAVSAFGKTSGSGTFSGGGSDYTLNLGTLLLDSGTVNAALFAENAALGPADLLDGDFSVSSGSGFGLSGFDPFTDLAAGNQVPGLDVSFDPSSLGSFSETIDLSGIGHNASGYSAAIGDTFLTIEANVTGTATPEPPSWAVMLAGLFGLGAIGRRARRRPRG